MLTHNVNIKQFLIFTKHTFLYITKTQQKRRKNFWETIEIPPNKYSEYSEEGDARKTLWKAWKDSASNPG